MRNEVNMTDSTTMKDAKNALGKVMRQFNDFGGIGETFVNGERCLVVYLDETVPDRDTHEVPSRFEGIRVVTRIKHDAGFL